MIEGTDSSIHDFDGCCYGLRQKFGDSSKYIKKPWRIVSWNVDVGNQLSLKCDGRHEHVPCAGTLRTVSTYPTCCNLFLLNLLKTYLYLLIL